MKHATTPALALVLAVCLHVTTASAQEPDPPDHPAWTAVDLDSAVKLNKDATWRDVQRALSGRGTVALEAGTVIEGALQLPDAEEQLVAWGEGPRPVIVVPTGEVGIDLTSDWIENVLIQGIEVRGPLPPDGELGTSQGIRLRINGAQGKHAKSVVIEDCKVTGFDTNIEIVDDYARRNNQPAAPGRINLLIDRCIVAGAAGSDSHHVGIYLEGLETGTIRDTIIDHSGWLPGEINMRNQRSHNIYAQEYNGPITIERCILTRAAANGCQLRAGGVFRDNLISECALGLWISERHSVITGNVVLDQVDIRTTVPGETERPRQRADQRGHGFQVFELPSAEVRHNLFARRHGGLANIPAVDVGHTVELSDNVVVDWQQRGQNFRKNRQFLDDGDGGNRTLEGVEVPAFTDERITHHLDRPRGVWTDAYRVEPFLAACRAAVEGH